MCLSYGRKVLANSEVNFQSTASEPATATCCKYWRFFEFDQTKDSSPKVAALFLTANGNSQVNMVQTFETEGQIIHHGLNLVITDFTDTRSLAEIVGQSSTK